MIISLISLVMLSGCLSDGKLSLEEKAEYEVIDNLREENFDVVYSLFNDDMKSALSEEDLEELWNSVITQYGEITDIESENASKEEIEESGEEYTSVFIPCEFMSGIRLNINVVFDEDEMVAGLWIVPI